jgi:hypothetical protein
MKHYQITNWRGGPMENLMHWYNPATKSLHQ